MPIVLCAIDWLGIANEGLEAWKEQLAVAAATTPDRVTIHTLHQHDAPRCDFTTERILQAYGLGGIHYDNIFLYETIRHVARAVHQVVEDAKPVTHLGYGQAVVHEVASNRRILGPDGKVEIIRWSKTQDSLAIAAPEGVIDPWLKGVSFWNEDDPIVVLTYYATHPQSYYGEGDVTAEFVGLARTAREKDLNDLPHVHFNGAGGNVAAGKYNDGSSEMRPILSHRIEDAMKRAWDHRTRAGKNVTLSALRMDKIWMLHLPGELFVEYQLKAQELRPGDHVCTAAYEEYGPGYIGTKIAYKQGGYETSERASRVSPKTEKVLMKAIKRLLE